MCSDTALISTYGGAGGSRIPTWNSLAISLSAIIAGGVRGGSGRVVKVPPAVGRCDALLCARICLANLLDRMRRGLCIKTIYLDGEHLEQVRIDPLRSLRNRGAWRKKNGQSLRP